MNQTEQELLQKLKILAKSYWALRLQLIQVDFEIKNLKLAILKLRENQKKDGKR